MNRRQRRAQGHRNAAHRILQAAQCPDCDSDVHVIEVGPDIYEGIVAHDDSCPWWRQFQRDGGYGIRL